MSLTNSVRLIGFLADKPTLTKTSTGTPMAECTVYTRETMGLVEELNQPHRCVAFGKIAHALASQGEKGRHIHLRGALRSARYGEGDNVYYLTNIMIDSFHISPRQSLAALKDTLREMIDSQHITEYDQLGLLKDEC